MSQVVLLTRAAPKNQPMLLLNGVSAWIEVDGKELEQHGVEEDPDRSQVTCWIAAQAGKAFSVAYKDNATYREHSLASSLQFDGSSIKGILSSANSPSFVPARTVVQSGQAISATTSRPFIFSKLELTDEDEYLNQAPTQLGEIHIRIFRVQVLGPCLFQPDLNASDHGKIHERSKKAVTHCVSYGQEVKTSTKCSSYIRRIDGNIPLATFIFKYRDFGLLQANGMIPMPPPAKPKAPLSGEVLDLTICNDVKAEPIGEVIEIVGSQKRSAILTKRSNSSYGNDVKPTKRIKRENTFVPTGEVIDLT